MRVRRLTTWLVLGIAIALAYAARRRRGAPQRRAVPAGARGTPAEIDESMLARGDEAGDLFIETIAAWDLEVEEAELDLDVSEPTRGGGIVWENGGEVDTDESAEDRRARRGSGELYGVHVAPAEDRELLDDDRAQDEGESWLEHLNATAAELGPEPERVLDMADDSDPHAGHHKTATSDTPVADHGSGGPRGL